MLTTLCNLYVVLIQRGITLEQPPCVIYARGSTEKLPVFMDGKFTFVLVRSPFSHSLSFICSLSQRARVVAYCQPEDVFYMVDNGQVCLCQHNY
uniref:Uncharacterized protein n=1 Tax=Arion vulgaris TaxID=1028688 RepID=A0A0B7AWR6_9EUPU